MIETIVSSVTLKAHAQAPGGAIAPGCPEIFSNGGYGLPGQGFACVGSYISTLTFVVISLAASISLIMLMVNGFRYMIGPAMPGGSSDGAKKGMVAALTGLALALLTYIILDTLICAVTTGPGQCFPLA